ncbi:MAG: GNAT family N-acetyltransferase, partial [Chloroflexota bacterium]|nr:GNAT family N-acetyltransferase [Chloroflexota bacterium]
DGVQLVGCVRILADGYLFSTTPEILVLPTYQGRGISRRLLELASEPAPTSLFFGVQPGKEGFFERLGYEHSLNAYHKRKPRGA